MHEKVNIRIKLIIKKEDLLNKQLYNKLILENIYDFILYLEKKKKLLKFKCYILAYGAKE